MEIRDTVVVYKVVGSSVVIYLMVIMQSTQRVLHTSVWTLITLKNQVSSTLRVVVHRWR